MSAYGIYKAKVISPFASGSCQVLIPQLFGDVRVVVTRFLSVELPTTTRTGWVMFEGGEESNPVWVDADTELTEQQSGSGLYEVVVTAFNAGTGYITGDLVGVSTLIAPFTVRTSDIVAILPPGVGDRALVFYPAGAADPLWLPRVVDAAQTAYYDGRYLAGSSYRYLHTQGVAAFIWTMNHNLGSYPNVTLFDYYGNVIEGEIVYTSVNQAVAYFSILVDGSAVFS